MGLTHEELLTKISDLGDNCLGIMAGARLSDALRAVVELHKPMEGWNDLEVCNECSDDQYVWLPCPTIQAIEKELG